MRPPATRAGIVYCSGPLFCPEEIGAMTAIADVVEAAGYETFLPHRDGIEAYVMRFASTPLGTRVNPTRGWIDRAIFALDVYQIVERATHVVFNMNGRVPDEGGVAEAAIAFSVGTPVVLYKNDSRAPFGGLDNAMVTGLSTAVVSRIGDISKAVARTARRTHPRRETDGNARMAPELARAVSLGRNIWRIVDAVNRRKGEAQPDDLVRRVVEICKAEGAHEERTS